MDNNATDKVSYLNNGMFYLGFTRQYENEIAQKIQAGQEQFSIDHEARFHGKDVDFRIDFKTSAATALPHIQGYLLTPKANPESQQYFSVYKNRGFTAKEAFNLVEQRAVCKDHRKGEEKYQSWHIADVNNRNDKGNFKIDSYHQNYGFDVAKALQGLNWSQVDGKGMPPWAEENLRKGDPLRGTLQIGGQNVEVNIVAAPKTREVLGMDDEGKILARAEGISEVLQKEKGAEKNEAQQQQSQGQVSVPETEEFAPGQQQAEQTTAFSNSMSGDDGIDSFLQELARDMGVDVSEIENDIPFDPALLQHNDSINGGAGETASEQLDITNFEKEAAQLEAYREMAQATNPNPSMEEALSDQQKLDTGSDATNDASKERREAFDIADKAKEQSSDLGDNGKELAADKQEPGKNNDMVKAEGKTAKAGGNTKSATAATDKKAKSKVERIPPRQHPPMEQAGLAKGKRH